ncbi:hypothetical protein MCAP1_001359 [Malassezia caprae]|uniref:chitin deacetylase n=1 Tax=Malassezia caprae TaxID=1381934 RepID=A0AAF0E6I5_9BASI|nr:hypothetical protein MCAP1_001359 [Malassezia caprae]
MALVSEKHVAAHHRFQRLHARDETPTMSSWAKKKGAKQECKDYSLPSSAKLQKIYPHGNKIANIVDGDNEAQSLWKEIQSSGIIPSQVKVKKGTEDHMGVKNDGYDADSDPDCWWSASGCTKPKAKGLSKDIYECPEPHTWGLTFDDGPNCGHNEFYDYLKDNQLKATLFYIGANVRDYPLQAQRGLADGHDICLHTWSHHYMTTLSDEQVFAELYYSMRIVKDVLGITTRCWRPPFGDVDDRVRAIASGLGLRTIIWDRDTDDWDIKPDGNSPTQKIDSNYQKIIDLSSQGKVNDKGVVVLTHEINSHTMQEFMKMFPKVKKAYKNVVPLTACMNVTTPYVEEDIQYPVFKDFISGKVQPKGLPDMDSYEIAVASKLKITKESDQNTPGGFSASSPQAASTSEDSQPKDSQPKDSQPNESKPDDNKQNSSESEPKDESSPPKNASERLRVASSLMLALAASVGVVLWW